MITLNYNNDRLNGFKIVTTKKQMKEEFNKLKKVIEDGNTN